MRLQLNWETTKLLQNINCRSANKMKGFIIIQNICFGQILRKRRPDTISNEKLHCRAETTKSEIII